MQKQENTKYQPTTIHQHQLLQQLGDDTAAKTPLPSLPYAATTTTRPTPALSNNTADIVVKPKRSKQQLSLEEDEQVRQSHLIRVLSLGIVGLELLSASYGVVMLLTGSINTGVGLLFASLPLLGIGLLCYWLAGRGRNRIASRILIGSQLLAETVLCLSYGTDSSGFALFFIAIVLSLLLLPTWEAMGIALYAIGLSVDIYIFQDILEVYTYPEQVARQSGFTPQQMAGMNIFLLVAAFAVVTMLLLIPFRNQTRALKAQNERLQVALHEIQARQQLGQESILFRGPAQLTMAK